MNLLHIVLFFWDYSIFLDKFQVFFKDSLVQLTKVWIYSSIFAILSAMKTLYLIRHAKSDWSDPALNDFDRGLNKRGKRSIPLMAKALKEKGVMPDLILASAAKRAKKTAKGLARELGYSEEIRFDESLYFTEPETMMEKIRNVDHSCETLFLIGHNPEITELSNILTETYIDNIPTLGIVSIALAIEKWKEVEKGKGKMQAFIFPRMFSN